MSVYTKLNEARAKFHALKLEKTGWNGFAKYKYFELGDFLIPALTVFNDVGLCAVVSFDKELATMTIMSIDPADAVERIAITSPMPASFDPPKGMQEIQNIGAIETYHRRYLWVAALEIVEHDALDATTGKTDKKDGIATDVTASGPAEAFKSLQPEAQNQLRKIAAKVVAATSAIQMLDIIDFEDLDNDEKAGLWSLLDSKTRSAIKAAQKEIAA